MKFFLSIFLVSCMVNQQSTFYKKVLSDFRDGSYYLSISVKALDFSGKVVVENTDFFYYLNQIKGIRKNTYQGYTLGLLKSEKPLDIGDVDFKKWNFYKVPSIQSINQNAEKGAVNFIATYFDGSVLKDSFTDEERAAIINQLFEWEIPSNIDGETGYLIISR